MNKRALGNGNIIDTTWQGFCSNFKREDLTKIGLLSVWLFLHLSVHCLHFFENEKTYCDKNWQTYADCESRHI